MGQGKRESFVQRKTEKIPKTAKSPLPVKKEKAEESLLIKQDMSAVRQVAILKAAGCRYTRYNRTALQGYVDPFDIA